MTCLNLVSFNNVYIDHPFSVMGQSDTASRVWSIGIQIPCAMKSEEHSDLL